MFSKNIKLMSFCLLCVANVTVKATSVQTQFQLSEWWTNNSYLSNLPAKQHDWVTELRPTIQFTGISASKQFFRYSPQLLYYVNQTHSNHIVHQAAGQGIFNPLSLKQFSIHYQGGYTQQVLNPLSEYTMDNRFGSTVPEIATFNINPQYESQKGPRHTLFSLSQTYSKFFNTDQPDWINRNVSFLKEKKRRIGPENYIIRLSGRENVRMKQLFYRSKSAQINGSIPISHGLWLLSEMGYETLQEWSSKSYRQAGYDHALGMMYSPNPHISIRWLLGETPQGKRRQLQAQYRQNINEWFFFQNESVENSVQIQSNDLSNAIQQLEFSPSPSMSAPFTSALFLHQKKGAIFKRENNLYQIEIELNRIRRSTLSTQDLWIGNTVSTRLLWKKNRTTQVHSQIHWQKQQFHPGLTHELQQWVVSAAYQYQLKSNQSIQFEVQRASRRQDSNTVFHQNQIGIRYSLHI